MTSTEPSDGLEELREAFLARLHTDRVFFVTLSAALARAEEDPRQIFLDLRNRAHRIAGGAAVFEFAAVATAARELEIAAVAAGASHADNTDAGVWSALVALVGLMGDADQGVVRHRQIAARRLHLQSTSP
jgi:HPt (histidine-containing phosphotransfer) domain-containing protein